MNDRGEHKLKCQPRWQHRLVSTVVTSTRYKTAGRSGLTEQNGNVPYSITRPILQSQWFTPRSMLGKVPIQKSRRRLGLFPIAIATAALAGCGTGVKPTAPSGGRKHLSDPQTTGALLAIAVKFNRDYSDNLDGPVWDRWDIASQAIISRSNYLRRHTECQTAPGPATIEGANPTSNGYWQVHYSISGYQFTDYWHYQNHLWRFNLALSNPSAVKLYRLPFAAYASAIGCNPSN